MLFDADAEREREALVGFQQLIEDFCEHAALQPGRDAEGLTERPVILSVPWPTEDHESMELVANMETYLAAGFFEQMTGQAGD